MKLLRFVMLLLATTSSAAADDWPAWRGPAGQGHSGEKRLPTHWSPEKNIRWKVALPDRGNSTPVIWGERVFVTQAIEKRSRPPRSEADAPAPSVRGLWCLHRGDGRLLWKREIDYPHKEWTHPTNPYCSASPVTDGERVVVSYGSAGMYCYDFEGKELWRKDLGKLEQIWGNASSPILYGDLVILWCGPGERQFLLAVDKKTGETRWEQNEPGGNNGKGGDWIGSWTTPIIVHAAGRDELILGVPNYVKAFDPKTGKMFWSCGGFGKLMYISAVCSDDGIIVAMSGYHGPTLAVRAGGQGDVTASHRLWQEDKKIPQRIGSPVLIDGHGYILNENGLLQCFDVKTGKTVSQRERLSSSNWGSMTAADGKLYVTNQAGDTFVIKATPELELVAKNSLGEHVNSSIAISNGELFIRTYKHLWCVGNGK